MLSQVFVLSPRGDVIVFKDFKGNVPKGAAEAFFRRASAPGGAPPAFAADGVQYLHVRAGGLLWVATTRGNVSPSLVAELLLRLASVTRDVCGALSEDAVRRNFIIVYELLDEVLDAGFPQTTSTARLKAFIAGAPAPARAGAAPPGSASAPAEVAKSVLDVARTGAREEIFVDVVERLTATFDAGGRLRASALVGAVQVKSYLAGNPAIELGLSENVVLGGSGFAAAAAAAGGGGGEGYAYPRGGAGAGDDAYGGAPPVRLDSFALHEDADAERFARDRTLVLVPPEGHFTLLSYRVSGAPFRPPFRAYPLVEDDARAPDRFTLYVRLRAEYAPARCATGVEVAVPLPRGVQRAGVETDSGPGGGGLDGSGPASVGDAVLAALPGGGGRGAFEQRAEWDARGGRLVWTLKNVRGGAEHTLRARVTCEPGAAARVRADFGPLLLQFVLPGKPSASGLDVRYMRILRDGGGGGGGGAAGGGGGDKAARWIRAVAMANSYQVRPW